MVLGDDVRTLRLLRHAKSSWSDPTLADPDRPLAPRGRRAAQRMAAHMKRSEIQPELVLCSPALRARRTLDLVSAVLPTHSEVLVEKGLYGMLAYGLLHRVQQLDDSLGDVLVVGHNPGLHDLAVELAVEGDAKLVARLRQKFPTCALATFVLEGSWAQLVPGRAVLRDFIVPRDLA